MLRSQHLLALIAFASPLVAQTSYLYSPDWIDTREGRRHAMHPGNYSTARYQFLDGELRGNMAQLRSIAFRLDYSRHHAYGTQGRTWSRVQIQLADGDATKFGTNLSANLLSSPTTVFDAAVTWPTVTGKPNTVPAAWGGPNGALRFPFKTTHVYGGTTDLVSDWTFTGGRLANNAQFWHGDIPATYPLDSWFWSEPIIHSPKFGTLPKTRLHNNSPGVTGRCNDSFYGTTPNGSYINAGVGVYSPKFQDPRYRGKIAMSSISFYTAPDAPVIHNWGVLPNATGIDFGTGCNKLHMDLVVIRQVFKTRAAGPYNKNGYSGSSSVVAFDWDNKTMGGLEIVAQAAWIDSVTGRLNLSQATTAKLPKTDFNDKPPARICAFRRGTKAPLIDRSPLFNPCMQYGK